MKVYRPIIEDKIELCNADGELVKEVPFRINVNEMYKTLTAKWAKLSAHVNTVGEIEDEEKTLEVVRELCLEAYGPEVVSEALEFFGDDSYGLSTLLAVYAEKVYPMMMRLRAETIRQKKGLNRYAETADGD